MKKILIATDFSDAALNAAKYGAEMARAIGTDIELLHVYEVPVPAENMPPVSEFDLRNEAGMNLEKLKDKLLKDCAGQNISINTEVRAGSFFNELNYVCGRIFPFAVILGSQGKTAMERLLFGSEAVYAMKHLPWPVITVPANATFRDIKKIGLACDFNHIIEDLRIDEIKRLVTIFNASLYVLNTGKQSEFDPEIIFESGRLQGMLKNLNAHYHFLSDGDIDECIMKFAEENDLDLLIVLPRRHSLVKKLFHKSHTKQLVLHSHVPVMALQL